jgi:hypothetical protein
MSELIRELAHGGVPKAFAQIAQSAPAKGPIKNVLDGVEDESKPENVASDYTMTDLALKAGAIVQEWAETDDLGPGESNNDRLTAMLCGAVNEDIDGDITPEEAATVAILQDRVWDYVSAMGASDEDLSAVLEDGDDEATDRVMELVAASLPDDAEEAQDHIDDFAFGDSDEVKLDAAKKGGKKKHVKKHITGKIRLSAPQKVALKKAFKRSHHAGSMHKRAHGK